ncbi:hypothetical protein BIFCAT_01301 [Bifidobacterium catenulatum DSM 16992 = JCM 1194 = LMG 11043]|uniref:Uncharacterized protein n=1 Tax=Bifidobacterium catenulatum DSM 16992 = JCM 1194 = LMG 11043 TaxID=566552 RepID=B6XVN8_9BIFI|nr:hypothetical protein BIFCAT_01301 [Bifidobacterium catenulatum DSM 16992 = JCM 1194 = LMG 11043]
MKRLAIFIVFEATINVPLQQAARQPEQCHIMRHADAITLCPKNRTASAY